MDPNATLEAIADALRADDIADALDYSIDLWCWLDKDGYPPQWEMYPRATACYLRHAANLGGSDHRYDYDRQEWVAV